jgi:hypothetical protein
MFGTVTSGMIADQLKTQFDVTLDKKKIHLEQPIKTLGDHEVELRLHADVISRLKVRVESSTAPKQLDADEGAAAGGREGARTESRGKRAYGDRAERGGTADRGAGAGRGDRAPRAGAAAAGSAKVEAAGTAEKGAKPEKVTGKARPHKEAKK